MRFFAECGALLALFALLNGARATERGADFFVIELDFDLEVFDFFADFFTSCLAAPLFDGEAIAAVLTLAGLALRTIGGAAAALSNGKGASSAKVNPENTKAPINNITFRSTFFPLFQSGSAQILRTTWQHIINEPNLNNSVLSPIPEAKNQQNKSMTSAFCLDCLQCK